MNEKEVIKIFKPNEIDKETNLYIEDGISAGFPSPASDFEESRISIEKVVIKNKESTFYAKVSGDSMKDAGLNDGDILVIDRSEELKNNKIAVCYLNGDFTVKRVKIEKKAVYLIPENKNYKPIKVTEENEFVVWGIVTYVIKKV
jgi:DNA polymerase V